MHPRADFDSHVELLTGYAPFPWQAALYEEFMRKEFPKSCDIPTGLGKTAVRAIWLLALAWHASAGPTTAFPRRLVYVVKTVAPPMS